MKILDGSAPEQFKVEVLYYDDEEKKKLLASPAGPLLSPVVGNIIEVSTAEFLTYYLFNLKRTLINLPTYESLAPQIARASRELDGFVDFNANSIRTAAVVENQRIEITERIGEAIGLSVISRIHQLIRADWQPLDKKSGPYGQRTLDYELASDSHLHVQVENKGSSVLENSHKSSPIYQQAFNIRNKKEEAPSLVSSVRYGTITAIDSREDSIVKCYIMDPEPESIARNPMDARLLSRMRFLQRWISYLSPKSQLATALASRLIALEYSSNFSDLDGVPLLRGDGRLFELSGRFGEYSPFFNTKSKIVGGPTGGVVIQLSADYLFFVGVMEDLLLLSTSQDFEAIRGYSRIPGTVLKTVECLFPRGRLRNLILPDNLKTWESGSYQGFHLEGRMYYSSAGLVFGFLPLNPALL